MLDTGYTTPTLHENQLAIGGCAYTKGWTRSCAAIFIALRILDNDLFDDVAADNEKLLPSLATIYGQVGEFKTDVDRVMGNRGRRTHAFCLRDACVVAHHARDMAVVDRYRFTEFGLRKSHSSRFRSAAWIGMALPIVWSPISDGAPIRRKTIIVGMSIVVLASLRRRFPAPGRNHYGVYIYEAPPERLQLVPPTSATGHDDGL